MRLGLITGSGSRLLANLIGDQVRHIDTPWGEPSGPLHIGRTGDVDIVSLARHGSKHSIAPHLVNYRANIWALHVEGVEAIVAVNAVGGIATTMPTGTLVAPDQLVDYTWGRDTSFYDGTHDPLRHVDVSHPFDARITKMLVSAASASGQQLVDRAVYGVTQGPRLETIAEINRMERDGCDIVGMTAMPEAALASELAIPYAMLCVVVNPAAGRGVERIEMADIERALHDGMQRVAGLLRCYFAQASGSGGSQGSA